MPPGSSGCAAGGRLAGPAGALRPPKRRPGDVRPPLPPRPHLPPPPAVPAWSRVGRWGAGGPGWENGEGRAAPPPAKREREERAGSGRAPAAAAVAAAARVPPFGGLPRAARGSGCGVRRPGPGGRSRAAAVARRRRWGRVLSWGEERRGRRGCAGRTGVGGARPGRRGSPPAPGGGPASGRPPLPRPTSPPPFRATTVPSSPLALRVRGRKPAPRPARPRSRPRSRGLRAPGGDPRDAVASSAVARPPPVRGRVVPRRGPVPSFRVGAGRAPPLPPAAASSGSSPHLRGGGNGSAAVVRAVSVPPPVRAPPSRRPRLPGGAAGGAVGRGSLSLVFSPRRARLPTERPGGREGGLASGSVRPPARPPTPARVRLPPSETRPQIRRGDPLNLSILVSGGKETNQDSLSNGE